MNIPQSVKDHYQTIEGMACYKGIPMLCVDGLHETLESLALEILSPKMRVLDVGCGRGAFSLRMHDKEFHVDAIDILDHCMCKEHVSFQCTRLEEMGGSSIYDAIFLIELLEHTLNPYLLLEHSARLVKPGGYVVISTPNIDSNFSRTWFFLKGRHWYFDPHNVTADGHITPIHEFQMEYYLKHLPFELVTKNDHWESRSAGMGIFKVLLQFIKSYQKLKRLAVREGPASIYVLKKIK